MMTKRLLLLTPAPLSLRDDESEDDFVDASPHLLRLSSVGTAAVVAALFCRSLLLLIVLRRMLPLQYIHGHQMGPMGAIRLPYASTPKCSSYRTIYGP